MAAALADQNVAGLAVEAVNFVVGQVVAVAQKPLADDLFGDGAVLQLRKVPPEIVVQPLVQCADSLSSADLSGQRML